MDEIAPLSQVDDTTDTRPPRRILIAIGLVLVVLILVGVAIYAGAFIMLAPMMQ
jgi:CHASE2 domain-containing sensor protein